MINKNKRNTRKIIHVLWLFLLIFSGCETLVFLRNGKPEKSDFRLYQLGYVNSDSIPKCNGMYIMEDFFDGNKFYRFYKFYENGQVLYSNFDSFTDKTSSLKYAQKGYYTIIKKGLLKLEMFANGYRLYYFLNADINDSADTIIIRKKTIRNGSKEEILYKKYTHINEPLDVEGYPFW